MGVRKERFSMPYGIAEVLRQTRLGDGYGGELGTCVLRHLLRDRRFIVSAMVERKRKSTDGRRGVARHKRQYRAGIDPTAEITADRDIGTHTQADRFIQDGKEA